MAKTRLSSYIRARLMELANEVLVFPIEQKACDKAYAIASKFAKDAVAARYPVADMEVLKRYDGARRPACVYLDLAEERPHVSFRFRDGDEAPFMARNAPLTFVVSEKLWPRRRHPSTMMRS